MSESANSRITEGDAGELTKRQELVLAFVVREHMRTAAPVGSKTLVERYDLGVSSATIRNDFARLEGLGFLAQPHASAGRVPTESGYRYFVENLMAERELPLPQRRRIRHQFHQLGLELDQWLHLSAAVLAETTRNAALVTAPRSSQARFKHLELISTYGNAVLLVLVLEDGSVKQQGLLTDETFTQEELSGIAERLSKDCYGLTTTQIRAKDPGVTVFEKRVMSLIVESMSECDQLLSLEAYHEGLGHLLSQPEFGNPDSARAVLRFLESNTLAQQVLPQALRSEGVMVIVGSGGWLDIDSYGLVLSRYGVAEEIIGALGVLGPMRMQYERVIPAVRYLAGLLSDLVWNLFGPSQQRQARRQPDMRNA